MTDNQQRVVELARAILAVPLMDVTEAEWALLMLAAEWSDVHSPPLSVANRVLDQFDQSRGYFDIPGINADASLPAGRSSDEGEIESFGDGESPRAWAEAE